MSQASSLRAVLYALGANSGILIAKGAAAAITGSSAMLAEAIHSAADCGNQVLLLVLAASAVLFAACIAIPVVARPGGITPSRRPPCTISTSPATPSGRP